MGEISKKRSTGITAMVLGILSLVVCGILTGIPAIILGKMNNEPSQQGMATAGVVMGWISVAIAIFFMLLIMLLIILR